MPTVNQLIGARRKELLALGYKPGIVNLAMEWAMGCADGMAGYALKVSDESEQVSRDNLVVTFLPRYLKDCEKWIQAFGHQPGEVVPEA
jgi:hypothetical protein